MFARFLLAAMLVLQGHAIAAEVTINPPAVTMPINIPPFKVNVPTVKGDKGDKGDPGITAAGLAVLTARITALEAAVIALKLPPLPSPAPTPPLASTPVPAPAPVAANECTQAAIMGSATGGAAVANPADPTTWKKVEIKIGPTEACKSIAVALSNVPGDTPLDLIITLDPSVEYVDDTSAHWREGKGLGLPWPPFEQTIRWKTLIRSKPGSGKLAVLRSTSGSLYYGKGIFILQPMWDGADQTLEGIHLIGVRGNQDSRFNSIWIEPTDKRATITFRDVKMEEADTCILNGGVNHSIVIERMHVHNCGTGTGLTHNIYFGTVASVTARDLLSTGVRTGHLFKSRAAVNDLKDIRVLDGPATTVVDYDGETKPKPQSSYALDFPNGGIVRLENIVTHKGPNASNGPSMAYGEEGSANGGQWNARSISVKGWTMLGEVNPGTPFGGAMGIWNASDTGGTSLISPTIEGLSVFGIPSDRLLRTGSTFGTLPHTRLPAMPALNMASPIRLP